MAKPIGDDQKIALNRRLNTYSHIRLRVRNVSLKNIKVDLSGGLAAHWMAVNDKHKLIGDSDPRDLIVRLKGRTPKENDPQERLKDGTADLTLTITSDGGDGSSDPIVVSMFHFDDDPA